MFGAIIGAISGAIINGVTSAITNGQRAKASREYASKLEDAANKYSGDALLNKMYQGGRQENLQRNAELGSYQSQFAGNRLQPTQVEATNGYNAGAAGAQQLANAEYNNEVGQAGRDLKQANINADVTQAGVATGLDTLGNAAKTMQETGAADAIKNKVQDLKNLYSSSYISDENCKDFEHADIQDTLRQLRSIIFKYTPEAQKELGVDDDVHVGITAQSAEDTPLDDGLVKEENGIKELDKQKLMETVTAGIAELQREIDEMKQGENKDAL